MLRSFHMLFLSLMGRLPTYFPEQRKIVKDMFIQPSNERWRRGGNTDHSSPSWLSRSRLDPWSWQSRNLWSFLSVCLSPPGDQHDSLIISCLHKAEGPAAGSCLRNAPIKKGTLALRKDGYLLKALARMSSLTSLPRSPQKIRKSSVTWGNSVRYPLQQRPVKVAYTRSNTPYIPFIQRRTIKCCCLKTLNTSAWVKCPGAAGIDATFAKRLTSKELFTSFPIQQTGVLPTDPSCSTNALLHFLHLPFLFVLCNNFCRLNHRHRKSITQHILNFFLHFIEAERLFTLWNFS